MKFDCPRCHGNGKIEISSLSKIRQKFLRGMAKLGDATVEEIHKACGGSTSLNATYRMVERLEALGLVRRVGNPTPGKAAKWRVG